MCEGIWGRWMSTGDVNDAQFIFVEDDLRNRHGFLNFTVSMTKDRCINPKLQEEEIKENTDQIKKRQKAQKYQESIKKVRTQNMM